MSWVLTQLMRLISGPPDFWDAEDSAWGWEDHPSVWTDGVGEDYPIGGFEVAGGRPGGVQRRNTVMLGWSAAVSLYRSWGRSKRFSLLSCGVLFWLCKPLACSILVLTIPMPSGPSVGFWMVVPLPSLCLW